MRYEQILEMVGHPIEFSGDAVPDVAPAGKARAYFDKASGVMMVSCDGGEYLPLMTPPTAVGAQNQVLASVPTTHKLGEDCILCLPLRADATDVGPNAFAVTNHGTVTFDATNGADFNGTDQWLSAASNAIMTPSGSFSLYAEFNPATLPVDQSNTVALLSKANNAAVSYDIYLEYNSSGWRLRGDFSWNDSGNASVFSANDSIQAGTRYAALFAFDESTGNLTLTLDTILVATRAVDVPSGGLIASTATFDVAKEEYADIPTVTQLDGTERNLGMWARALTNNDALALYNNGVGQSDGGLDVDVNDETGALVAWSDQTETISFSFGNGVDAIADDLVALTARLPWDCTVLSVALASVLSGSVTVDLWANQGDVPGVADSITASLQPALASAKHSLEDTLTGWTVDLNEGMILACKITNAATITDLNVVVTVKRR